MILLDTNVVSELMRREPDPTAAAWVDSQALHDLYISAVTRAEIELGVALLAEGRRKQGLETVALRLFGEFHGRCLAFDEHAARLYAEFVTARRRAGRSVTVEDAQIAAIALAGGLTLATRNTKDFEGTLGLSMVDPFAE